MLVKYWLSDGSIFIHVHRILYKYCSGIFCGYQLHELISIMSVSQVLVIRWEHFYTCKQNEFISVYKQARRRKVCSAIVNACLRVRLSPSEPHWLVEEVSLCYGGVGSSVVAAEITQRALIGE